MSKDLNSEARDSIWRVWWILLKLGVYLIIAVYLVRYLLPSAANFIYRELSERYGIVVIELKGEKLGSNSFSFDLGKFTITKPVLRSEVVVDQLRADFDRNSIARGRLHDIQIKEVNTKIAINAISPKTEPTSSSSSPLILPFDLLEIEKLTAAISGLPNLKDELKLSFTLSLNPKPADSQVVAKISKLNGQIDNLVAVTNLEADLVIDLSEGIRIDRSSVKVESINPGIKISEFKSRFSYSGTTLKLAEVSGQILGGQFSVSPTDYSFVNTATNSLDLVVKDISITEILALYPNERVQGEGKLSAKIPLTISKNGFSVKGGTFVSDGRGRLKTKLGENLGSGDLSTAAQALQNLEFDKLNGDIDLTEAGDLTLMLQISGRNPEMNNGQPLNVNIKLEENLKALFKTLRISDSLTGAFGR